MIDKEQLKKEILFELSSPVEVFIEVCEDGVIFPEYKNIADAGMDIRANKDVILMPGQTKVIPTGIKLAIPQGYEIQVRPRSGISLNTPLRVSNSPGTIDSGYRNEIGIILTNTSKDGNKKFKLNEIGNKEGIYLIKKGDRIAQLVLCKVEKMVFKMVNSVDEYGLNRKGGFGSTGIK